MQMKPAGSGPPLNESEAVVGRSLFSYLRRRAAIGVAIFLLAFGVRVLTWHDTRLEVRKVQSVVVGDYQRIGQLLRDGGISSFFSRSSPLADLNNLGHPPGYSLLVALIYSLSRSDAAIQFVQIAADALAAVILFLIVAELLPLSAGVVAGLLAAFAPQFAWDSVLLLPDSISVVPILLAIYLLTRAAKHPRLLWFILIGALIGVSCWLRANAMLLTLFIAAATLLLVPRKRRQFALAVLCGTLLIVLPLTIRNAMVFHRLIPLSLGAGQTFLEGIADYDQDSRFGVPSTDMGIMKQEAEIYQRPDYYGTLFNPDGVERERARLLRGFAIVRSHPVWFASVMAKRASSMVRLERARMISLTPPVSHQLDTVNRFKPVGSKIPSELLVYGVLAPNVKAFPDPQDGTLVLTGNREKYGEQFSSGPFSVRQNNDYAFMVPFQLEHGRIRVSVVNATGKIYASTVVETLEATAPEDQPHTLIALPFVSSNDESVGLLFASEASTAAEPFAKIGEIKLFELGPARFLWTHYPRIFIRAIQRIFLTAVMLPLAIIGLLIAILRRQTVALVIMSVVPIYFLTVQSAVHTEYRYVIAVTYFLFAFAGIAIGVGLDFVFQKAVAQFVKLRMT
jgi:hypothetical protein